MKIFEEYNDNKVKLKNRIVVAPMCMNSCEELGMANDFHLVHYGSYALGGAALITIEATAVSKNGRIYKGDIGLFEDKQIEPIKRIVDFCKKFDSKISVQLAHAGRKCETDDNIIAPSAIAFSGSYKMPIEMTKEDIDRVVCEFKNAANRAVKASVYAIEIHAAHGYLINQFLSPLTNKRKDNYGGSLENRVRFLKEVTKAVKSEMHDDMPLILRVSASDYKEGGIDIDEMVKIINLVKEDFDLIHVSSGGVVSDAKINVYPGYQVEFSKIIKEKCNVKTIAVGLINNKEEAEKIIENNEADLIALGRAFLRDPQWVLNESLDKKFIPTQLSRGY